MQILRAEFKSATETIAILVKREVEPVTNWKKRINAKSKELAGHAIVVKLNTITSMGHISTINHYFHNSTCLLDI